MSLEARCAAGDWYAVVGDEVTVVLPASQRSRVAQLWDLADSGAGVEAILDALLAGGLSSLDHLALIAHSSGTTRVIVRGTPTATISTASGSEDLSAGQGTTWAERVLNDATGVRLTLGSEGAAADRPLGPGVARVGALALGAAPEAAPEVAAEASSEPAAPAVAEEPAEPEPAVVEPEPEPVAEESAEPEPAAVEQEPEPAAVEPEPEPAAVEPEPEPEPVVVEPEPAVVEPEPEPVEPELVEAEAGGEPVLDESSAMADASEPGPVMPEVEAPPAADSTLDQAPLDPVATPEPEAAPLEFGDPATDVNSMGEASLEEDDWADRDGMTQVGRPVPSFDRPPIPGQEMAPPVVSEPVAALVFSTGEVIAVDRAVLVGRAPEARQFASHDQPHVVTVPSPQQQISSTHLEIRPGAGADLGSAIATDLGSTNGTVLAQPGLEAEDLKPGIAVSLIPGAILDLGDGVTIQVTNP